MLKTIALLSCVALTSLIIPACSSSDEDETCPNGVDCYGVECADITTVGDGTCDDANLCDLLDNDGGDCGDVATGDGSTGDSGSTSSFACEGACDPEDPKYNACTCGSDDPCGWINDQYCDDYCAETFPENFFEDDADCPECGNGAQHGDEECDTGGESATCDDDCTAVACGDGNLNEAAGEVCDDGATDACGECNADCTGPGTEPCEGDEPEPEAVCGNGAVEDGEVCDDGYTDACGTCNADCSGVGEGAACGDGEVCPQLEACDDGSTDACGECNTDCTAAGEGECPPDPTCSATWAECAESDYEDMTAQDGPIAIQVNPFSSYTPKCVTVQVGQSVSIGVTSTHPLMAECSEPGQGAFTTDGSSSTLTLTVPGYYNYQCGNHGNMLGNIKVIP